MAGSDERGRIGHAVGGFFEVGHIAAGSVWGAGNSAGSPRAVDLTHVNAVVVHITNDTDETTVSVPLSGTGADQEIDVSPTSLSFGSHAIDDGPSIPQGVSITNLGTAPIDVCAV